VDRIKNALEVYYLEKGRYPDTGEGLEAVVAAGLLREGDLHDGKGMSYRYERREGRYFLKH
jgi:hypothetical protein